DSPQSGRGASGASQRADPWRRAGGNRTGRNIRQLRKNTGGWTAAAAADGAAVASDGAATPGRTKHLALRADYRGSVFDGGVQGRSLAGAAGEGGARAAFRAQVDWMEPPQ